MVRRGLVEERDTHTLTLTKKIKRKKNSMKLWEIFLKITLAILLMAIILRLSEISTRMRTFEAFIMTAVTQSDLVTAMRATPQVQVPTTRTPVK